LASVKMLSMAPSRAFGVLAVRCWALSTHRVTGVESYRLG
jgi:hypothetical protein